MRRPHLIALALILVAGFALRVWNIDYGLPFVYSIDEGSHFTSRAVEMFWQDLDPGYYQNPAAYTYLVYALLRVMYGPLGFVFDLPFGNVTDQFDKNPTEIWIAARTLAAALCMGGVAATYWAARRLWGVREGLVAAAVLAFAFLPVAYSRVAVTDVGALIGVALSMGFAVRAYERGALRWFLAGRRRRRARGLVQVHGGPRAAAARDRRARARARGRLARARRARGSRAALAARRVRGAQPVPVRLVRRLVERPARPGRGGARPAEARARSRAASRTTSTASPGASAGPPRSRPCSAPRIELRRNLVRGLMLIAVPLALFVYLSVQSRYFGRWLLPAYPALAMLAAAALGQAADLLADSWRRRPGWAGVAAAGGLTVLVLAQPLAADVRARRCSAATTRASRRATGSRLTIRPSCAPRSSRPCPGAGSARTPRARRRAGSRAARSRPAGPSRAGRTRPRAAGASARSTSPASSRARTAAFGPPPTTRCSTRA